jgi:heme exporter protein D
MGACASRRRERNLMHWNSFEGFVHMGGYGLYVWGSYGVTLVVMLAEAGFVVQRRRRAFAALRSGGRP